MVWMGIFRITAPIIGQLGGLVPAVQLISLSISHMARDSTEEVIQRPATRMTRRGKLFHHQVCGPIVPYS